MYKKTQSLYISLRRRLFIFLFLRRAPVLLLHVLIDCSPHASGDPAQQSANPPVIITPKPSLRGTSETWICCSISERRGNNSLGIHCETRACYTVRIQEEVSHLSPFQNHSPWGIRCCSLCQVDLFWFLEEREQNITQLVKVVECIYAWQAQDHQAQLFFFLHQNNTDNGEVYLESWPQPRCHSHHLFALLTILKTWFVHWEKHSRAKLRPVLMKGTCYWVISHLDSAWIRQLLVHCWLHYWICVCEATILHHSFIVWCRSATAPRIDWDRKSKKRVWEVELNHAKLYNIQT